MRSISYRKVLTGLAVAVFWLAVWEAAAFFTHDIVLVSPRAVLVRLFELVQTGDYWRTIGLSSRRILSGFGIALVVGVLLAAFSHAFRIVRALFEPAVNIINAVPIASFAVMALLAFGSAYLAVFVVFVTVLPLFYMNTLTGFDNADAKMLEMAKVLRAPRMKVWRYVYLTEAMPHAVASVLVGFGFAWKSGVAAELIGLVRGTIGGSLHMARISILTADLFAWTITILLLSWACRAVVGGIVKWRGQ